MQRGDVILTMIQEQVTENLVIDRWNEDRIFPPKNPDRRAMKQEFLYNYYYYTAPSSACMANNGSSLLAILFRR